MLLGEKGISSNDERTAQKKVYLEDLDKIYYLDTLKKLEKPWKKCKECVENFYRKTCVSSVKLKIS